MSPGPAAPDPTPAEHLTRLRNTDAARCGHG
jgi:hypothetical protein